MKIRVKWTDILAGKAINTTQCMVALALKRELGVSYASVGHQLATIAVRGEYAKVYLPKTVGDRIKFWDRFHFVLPFSFELQTSGYLAGESIEECSAQATFAVPAPRYAFSAA